MSQARKTRSSRRNIKQQEPPEGSEETLTDEEYNEEAVPSGDDESFKSFKPKSKRTSGRPSNKNSSVKPRSSNRSSNKSSSVKPTCKDSSVKSGKNNPSAPRSKKNSSEATRKNSAIKK